MRLAPTTPRSLRDPSDSYNAGAHVIRCRVDGCRGSIHLGTDGMGHVIEYPCPECARRAEALRRTARQTR